MGENPIDPANVEAFRVLMTTLYILSVFGTVYALFGIVRTAHMTGEVMVSRAGSRLLEPVHH